MKYTCLPPVDFLNPEYVTIDMYVRTIRALPKDGDLQIIDFTH